MLWLTTGEGPGPGETSSETGERQIPLAAPGSAIRVRGDHMAPTIISNDLVSIDPRQRDPTSDGGIWAIRIEGQTALARIQMRPGKAFLHFDNPATPPFEVPIKSLEILGRVVRLIRET
jgi:phage repressor protein C with HTH and peptisase S24 domain